MLFSIESRLRRPSEGAESDETPSRQTQHRRWPEGRAERERAEPKSALADETRPRRIPGLNAIPPLFNPLMSESYQCFKRCVIVLWKVWKVWKLFFYNPGRLPSVGRSGSERRLHRNVWEPSAALATRDAATLSLPQPFFQGSTPGGFSEPNCTSTQACGGLTLARNLLICHPLQHGTQTLDQRAQMTDLERLRHSAAHVLATAILKLLPNLAASATAEP